MKTRKIIIVSALCLALLMLIVSVVGCKKAAKCCGSPEAEGCCAKDGDHSDHGAAKCCSKPEAEGCCAKSAVKEAAKCTKCSLAKGSPGCAEKCAAGTIEKGKEALKEAEKGVKDQIKL